MSEDESAENTIDVYVTIIINDTVILESPSNNVTTRVTVNKEIFAGKDIKPRIRKLYIEIITQDITAHYLPLQFYRYGLSLFFSGSTQFLKIILALYWQRLLIVPKQQMISRLLAVSYRK